MIQRGVECLKWLISKFEVNLGNEEKNLRLYNSSRELVAMLFAVVVGVGLENFGDAIKNCMMLFQLTIVYIAVLLSWWGYNYGTIEGPNETNLLNYGIDCILLGLYWALIHWYRDINIIFSGFLGMFIFYCLWELVRLIRINDGHVKKVIGEAAKVNFLAAIIIGILFRVEATFALRWISLILLFLLILAYRRVIHLVYSQLKKSQTKLYEIKDEAIAQLIEEAGKIRNKASAHLSNFKVGAALLSSSGKIYVGCNAEFDNYSNTIHAEEAAISAFISAGERNNEIVKIAISVEAAEPQFPCGMCRQSLFEMGSVDMVVVACNGKESKSMRIRELLPEGFKL